MNQTLSLVIPVYNEADHLEKFLTLIDGLKLPVSKELVIVNDGSADNSAEILQGFKFESQVVLINQPSNRGKGAAIRAGIQKATGDFIGIQDADFETDPNDIEKLLTPLLTGQADVVYGSRFKGTNKRLQLSLNYLANRLLTIFSNALSGLRLSDMETCYKFFRADVIKNIRLESSRFGFEPEVTAKVAKLNVRLAELPISYFPRGHFEGKKMKWRDGAAALKHIVHFNLLSRKPSDCFYDAMPLSYLPKKGGRL